LSSSELNAYLQDLQPSEEFVALFHRYGLIYRWYAVSAVIAGNVAAVLASTIINVAIPSIMGAFGVGQDQAQWLATSNLAAATVGMLCGHWCVQTLGLRGTVAAGMLLFLAGSILGGVSTNLEVMIFARVLQGIPAGLLAPLSMTIIFQVFPPGRQGMAMGISAMGIVLAPAVGPTLGGVAVDLFSWRYVFFFGVPFSAFALLLTAIFLPKATTVRPLPFDWIGLVLLTVTITSLLLALGSGEREGWNSDYILGLWCICLVSTALFIHWELNQVHPLLELSLFRQRQFIMVSIVAFLFGGGLYASTYLVPQFLQLVQNLTPTQSGALLMPAGFVMVAIFPLSGRLSDSLDTRLLLSIGSGFFVASFWLMGGADVGTGFVTFVFWVVLSRIGIGLVMPALQMTALQGVPLAMLTAASGAFSFMRQLGGAFGVNLSSVVLDRRTSFHFQALAESQSYDNFSAMQALETFNELSQREGLGDLEGMNMAIQSLQRMVELEALTMGFRDSFMVLAGVFVLSVLPVGFLRSRGYFLAKAESASNALDDTAAAKSS
jgi:EmrB/QacA subfamily drug resistance transporter